MYLDAWYLPSPSTGTTSSRKPPQAALIAAGLLPTCRLWCTLGVGGGWVWAHVLLHHWYLMVSGLGEESVLCVCVC